MVNTANVPLSDLTIEGHRYVAVPVHYDSDDDVARFNALQIRERENKIRQWPLLMMMVLLMLVTYGAVRDTERTVKAAEQARDHRSYYLVLVNTGFMNLMWLTLTSVTMVSAMVMAWFIKHWNERQDHWSPDCCRDVTIIFMHVCFAFGALTDLIFFTGFAPNLLNYASGLPPFLRFRAIFVATGYTMHLVTYLVYLVYYRLPEFSQ